MSGKPKLAVGVIGVGAMGMGVAKTLLRAGFPVRVRDIRDEAGREAAAAGAVVCASPAELARDSAVVITLVVDAAQTEDVLFGEQSVLGSAAPGSVVMMCSTVAPDFAESTALRLAQRGLTMLDAPVSGGPAKALAGEMSMMIAGDGEAYARCRATIEAVSGRHFYLGARAGDGSRMKIVNNMLAGVNLAAAAEAFGLARTLGLDPKAFYDVVCASSGASWMFADRMPRALADDYAPRAAVAILAKDLSIVLDAARAAGCSAPVASAAHAVYLQAIARGLGAEDDAALVKLYRAES